MTQVKPIYVLKLRDNGEFYKHNGVHIVPKGSILKFNLRKGAKALKQAKFFTNYPLTGAAFHRKQFHVLDTGSVDDNGDFSWSLNVDVAGPYEFFIEYGRQHDDSSQPHHSSGQPPQSPFYPPPSPFPPPSPLVGQSMFPPSSPFPTAAAAAQDYTEATHVSPKRRFVVEAPITLNGKEIPVEGICMQTVLTKCIGTINGWRQSLGSAKLARYNMIHFTPVQQLGQSRSAYSIHDQLKLANSLFVREQQSFDGLESPRSPRAKTATFMLSDEQKLKLLKDFTGQLEKEYGMLAVTDVVWNHTSFDSSWLAAHPEAGYTPNNTPHLKIAWELDEALAQFSTDLQNGVYMESHHLSNDIHTEDQLNRVLAILKDVVLQKLRLYEYYVINVDAAVEKLRTALTNRYITSREGLSSGGSLRSGGITPSGSSHNIAGLSYDTDAVEERIGGNASSLSRLYTAAEIAKMDFETRTQMLRRDGVYRRGDESGLSHFGSGRFQLRVDIDVAMLIFNVRQPTVDHSAEPNRFPTLIPQTYSQFHTYQQYISRISQLEQLVTDEDINEACKQFRKAIDLINLPFYRQYDEDRDEIIRNIAGTFRWERFNPYGPKKGPITTRNPIVPRYFTVIETKSREPMSVMSEDNLTLSAMSRSPYYIGFANNGWVMSANQAADFISPYSKAYYLRQVVIWGDCVKLRYGKNPSDSPWLWDHMKKYTEQMASVFHGFRIDNAHSTPLHVAEYLLDVARSVRPDLFVMAELFTGSEEKDVEFVERLGINVLIREAMNPSNTAELCHFLHRFGSNGNRSMGRLIPNTLPSGERIVQPTFPKSIIFECTHDNQVPAQLRTPHDSLPNAAIVAMANCATGSVRGYDEIYSQQVDLVNETRLYSTQVGIQSGIVQAKQVLNSLHVQLALENFSEIHIDQRNENVVCITRHNPHTLESYLLITGTAFTRDTLEYNPDGASTSMLPRPQSSTDIESPTPHGHQHFHKRVSSYHDRNFSIRVPGKVDRVLFASQLVIHDDAQESWEKRWQKSRVLRGLNAELIVYEAPEHIKRIVRVAERVDNTNRETYNEVAIQRFVPGAVILIHITMNDEIRNNVLPTLQPIVHFVDKFRTIYPNYDFVRPSTTAGVSETCQQQQQHAIPTFSELDTESIRALFADVDLIAMNRLLYSSDVEEKDATNGQRGAYWVPNHGQLVYCGLKGVSFVFDRIRKSNDMSHPMLNNIRDGNWLADYLVSRIADYAQLRPVHDYMQSVFQKMFKLQRYLIPKYFDAIITMLIHFAEERCFSLMSEFVRNGDRFVKKLAMNSVILYGVVNSAPLSRDNPELAASLSAGLPHFSTGYMRCWGRDTFISLRGLLLVTGRYTDARNLILGFATTLRHGLIPNLLDGGSNPRYNSRDSVWWFLQAVQDYVTMSSEGVDFLKTKFKRKFEWEPSEHGGSSEQSIADMIHEIMTKHANGIHFREWNAGKQIDDRMQDEGFNVDINFDLNTGFVSGGNQLNCGTWMDKMGESQKANNYGIPATPRDGADVEIIGLLKSTVRWLSELHEKHSAVFPYEGVEIRIDNSTVSLTYSKWNERIQKNFERYFYIPEFPEDDSQYLISKQYVNRRGIYKDIYGCSKPYCDYQLRPNFLVAMAVAPEMFDVSNAQTALISAERHLLGPLGMKTLDASDWEYRGSYHNSEDSDNYHTAKGFNYHQGPEWLWPLGYFLRARLEFFGRAQYSLASVGAKIHRLLNVHHYHMNHSPYESLPELTNKNGERCADSCDAQAWSISTILDALYDLNRLQNP